MGHVPTGPVPTKGSGAHFPGREHRRTGARNQALSRAELAAFGESVAAGFLARRGATILARNLREGHGELDLVVSLDRLRIAVEVKTIRAGTLDDPSHSFTDRKARQVRAVANRLGLTRVDLVAVSVHSWGVAVRWIPEAA